MGALQNILPMILMFVVLWFLMVRPQMKKAKEHKALIAALAKGDEVVTGGGLVGKVIKVGDNYVTLEIAEGTEVVVQKPSIGLVLPKGTLKSL
jgi:preprotein translocase subunit YajC